MIMSNVQIGQTVVNAKLTLLGWEPTVERAAKNVELNLDVNICRSLI